MTSTGRCGPGCWTWCPAGPGPLSPRRRHKPRRGDPLSIVGIAREVAAIPGAGVELLTDPELALALARAAAEGSGRPVTVKGRASDFLRDGMLSGAVERTAADAVIDPRDGQLSYGIMVRTDSDQLGNHRERLGVVPGMAVEVPHGDELGFVILAKDGAELMLQISRFWASIARYNEAMERYEIKGVMGPDEFHTAYPGTDPAEEGGIDNNAYTNVIAVWVLLRALDAVDVFDSLDDLFAVCARG